MNSVLILWNLTKDPEVRFTKSGRAVATFTVAATQRLCDAFESDIEGIDLYNATEKIAYYFEGILTSAASQKSTEQVCWQCKELDVKPVGSIVDVHFEWHVTGRHDPDNIDFARKFILDGLVMANVLKDDSQQYIGYLSSEIVRDTDNYVVVSLRKC